MLQLPSLVTPSQLVEHRDSAGLILLDTTWAMTRQGPTSPGARFAEAHIPGARFFDHERVRDQASSLHDTLCSAAQFQAYARELGLTDEHLVCYSQGGFSSAARAWWLFRVFGHDRVSVLDGGQKGWVSDGHGLTRDTASHAVGRFEARFDDRRFTTTEQLRERRERGVQVVDARPPDVFSGARDWFANRDSPAAGRPGTIVGARNMPSAVVSDGAHLKPLAELAAVARAAGIDASAPTVTSCSLGVGASGSAFVLHLLGNNDVAVFDGAWEAWTSQPDSRDELTSAQ